MTYSNVSLKFETLDLADGEVWEVEWKLVPRNHYDRKLVAMRPVWFARHPSGHVIYVCRAKGAL